MLRARILRLLLPLGLIAGFLVGCSRDPNVRKQKYFESGQHYLDKGQYREAAIQFKNAVPTRNSPVRSTYSQTIIRPASIWRIC